VSKSIMRVVFTFLCLFAFSTALMAQSTTKTEHRSVGKELDIWVSKTEEHLVPGADAMPEDKYGFAPTAGKFDGARTFAEMVKHLAATNYILASAVLREKPPHGERNESAPDSLKSKSEIMEYLKGSFVYLHRAAAAIDNNDQTEVIKPMDDRTRPGLIVDALCHSWDHYGQMVEYLRMNGIVPPASR
jgi:DinB superfamily